MNRGGFTLLELMVAIAVVFVVSMSVYVPWSHYQKKADFNLSIKQIVQLVSQARSSAIYGDGDQVNHSFGVYLSSDVQSAQLLSYPYNTSETISLQGVDVELVKDLKFPRNIQIDQIGGYENSLLLYEAISGRLAPYYFDSLGEPHPYETIPNIIEIDILYGESEKPTFSKTLRYYTSTHIIDY